MKAIRKSDSNFSNSSGVDFQKNKKLLVVINLLSFLLFIIFYILFDLIAKLFSLNNSEDIFYYFKSLRLLPASANIIFIVGLILILSVHELIHGLFFYIYTGHKPVIGFKSVYAFAGAPEWYIKKNYFQVITLSPFILMTLSGFILMSVVPAGYSSMIFLLMTVNAAGCAGDLWMSATLLRKPENTYVNDSGVSAVISW